MSVDMDTCGLIRCKIARILTLASLSSTAPTVNTKPTRARPWQIISQHIGEVLCFPSCVTYAFLQRCKAMDMSHLPAHKQYDEQPEQPHQEGAQGHALPSRNDDQEESVWQRDDRR